MEGGDPTPKPSHSPVFVWEARLLGGCSTVVRALMCFPLCLVCLLCAWEDCRWVVLGPPCHVMCNLLQHVMYVSLTMVMVVRVGSAVSLASLTGEARVNWK